MKGIERCIECANYNLKQHKCAIGCKKETNSSDPFYDDCPLPDVSEVRCGEWIENVAAETDTSKLIIWECSECGIDGATHKYNFCPYCGADMRRERK